MTRTRFTLAAALLAAVSMTPEPAAGQAAVSGTWELTWETPRGARTITMTLTQDSTTVTGTAAMPMGDVPVQDGVVDGDRVSFSLVMGRGDRTFEMKFEGTVDGAAMTGTMLGMRGNEVPFTGKRTG